MKIQYFNFMDFDTPIQGIQDGEVIFSCSDFDGDCKTNSSLYKKAYEFCIKYEYICETFDKRMCTGGEDSDGFIKPATDIESRLVCINAENNRYKLMYEINTYNKLHALQITTNDIANARNEVSLLTWKGLQEEYKRIYGENNI